MKFISTFLIYTILVFSSCQESQDSLSANSKVELGSNFNHNPEIIDFHYLEKAEVDWIRTTPYIFEYIFGLRDVSSEQGLQKLIDAGIKGYKIAFGFRWDFKKHNIDVPAAGSKEESQYFSVALEILEKVGPHVDVLKLGNEPILETKAKDKKIGVGGKIPLIEFTKRLLSEVVEPYYLNHPEFHLPDIYVGSIHALFSDVVQSDEATNGLIRFAQESETITGLSMHLHISELSEIEEAFKYVRTIMPEKPIIVPEFSLHRLYKSQLSDQIGSTDKGMEFAKQFNRNPDWRLYDWYSLSNSVGVSSEEWQALFESRSWFPKHYMRTYFNMFKKYGVRLATYPLLQQYCPDTVTEKSSAWFINPIFCQKSLEKNPNGRYSANPLCFNDFVELVRDGKLIE